MAIFNWDYLGLNTIEAYKSVFFGNKQTSLARKCHTEPANVSFYSHNLGFNQQWVGLVASKINVFLSAEN